MNADILREAARLMRERAEAATPGPWSARTTGVRGGDHWYICDPGQAVAWVSANDGENEEQRQPDAEHIASWPPAVALAVADLLDNVAGHIEFSGATEESEDVRDALVVARAYLST